MHPLEKCTLVLLAGDIPGNSDSAARMYLEHMFSQNDLGSRLGSTTRRSAEPTVNLLVTSEICVHAIYIPMF